MKENIKALLLLLFAALHILLALVGEDFHGYGIMLEVARQSEGQYKLGPGTLYDNLRKLMPLRCVEETQRHAADGDPRRPFYRLTGAGRGEFTAKRDRLEGVLRETKRN